MGRQLGHGGKLDQPKSAPAGALRLASDSLDESAGAMSDSFLEEQVRRIKQLTEWMTQVADRSHVEEEIARERESFGHGPLHSVRDMRVVDSVPRRSAADSPPRRRRR